MILLGWHYNVLLFLDNIFSKLSFIFCKASLQLLATNEVELSGTGSPPGYKVLNSITPTNCIKTDSIKSKSSFKVSPKTKDSHASFPPSLIVSPAWIIKLEGVSKLKPFWELKLIDFFAFSKIWSLSELKNNLPELIKTWLDLYDEGDVGSSFSSYDLNEDLGYIGIDWVEVKYIEDKSLPISSVIVSHPFSLTFSGWPFLIMVIGSPLIPKSDQLFKFKLSGIPFWTVLPNLILFPHLPSYIISPAKGKRGWILFLSIKVSCDRLVGLFNSILLPSLVVELLSVFLTGDPKVVCS